MRLETILASLVLLTACGSDPGASQAASDSPVPTPVTCPSPAPAPAPTPATVSHVRLKNSLVGQIRQIAAGADGWTAIGGLDLIIDDCTVSGDTIVCSRYPVEPFPYIGAAP